MASIPVYIDSARDYQKADQISKFISADPMFNVNIILLDSIEDEFLRLRKILEISQKDFPDSSIIYIRDNVIPRIDIQTFSSIIKSTMKLKEHLVYLSRNEDRCDLHSDPIEIPGNNYRITKIKSANVCNAVIISKEMRDHFLGKSIVGKWENVINDDIKRGTVQARAVVPNIFSPNTGIIECMADPFSNNEHNTDQHSLLPLVPSSQKSPPRKGLFPLWTAGILLSILIAILIGLLIM